MPMRHSSKPYTIKLRRTIEIEITYYATSAAEARRWAAERDMDDLQHMGNVAFDQCKVVNVTLTPLT